MKASIIFNPNAGTRAAQDRLQEAGKYLQSQGWVISWCQTEHAGHAIKLANQAAQRGDDVAVAVGGDGTINEVVNGLVGTETALGIIPAGTGNVFAVDMNIPIPGPLKPNAMRRAAEGMITGQFKRVDVARATFGSGLRRYFLLWAGIGLDAAISSTFEKGRQQNPQQKALGMLGWLITGLFVLGNFRGRRMWIELDDLKIDRRIILATINNSRLYGRIWRLSPRAQLDDGLLDVVLMEGYGTRSSVKHAVLSALGRHIQEPDVHIHQTKKVSIQTKGPVPVQLDAESVGFTPLSVEIVPQALKIIVPLDAPNSHFVSKDSIIVTSKPDTI